jgi:hypothetical protein
MACCCCWHDRCLCLLSLLLHVVIGSPVPQRPRSLLRWLSFYNDCAWGLHSNATSVTATDGPPAAPLSTHPATGRISSACLSLRAPVCGQARVRTHTRATAGCAGSTSSRRRGGTTRLPCSSSRRLGQSSAVEQVVSDACTCARTTAPGMVVPTQSSTCPTKAASVAPALVRVVWSGSGAQCAGQDRWWRLGSSPALCSETSSVAAWTEAIVSVTARIAPVSCPLVLCVSCPPPPSLHYSLNVKTVLTSRHRYH